MTTFEKIISLLNTHQVEFNLIEHSAEGRTDIISEMRGNLLQQAAKAMVLQVFNGSEKTNYVLAIVPGNCRVDFKKVAILAGGKKSSFAPPEIAHELTQCQMGAIPPFSFDDRLTLRIDERLCHVGKLYFNAGELDKSISLSVDDYFRMVGRHCISEISALATGSI
ncbi:YbaK/prolyl-tRNA synthetase associated domain-containing protein [Citrobacter freundii]|nr:YbaK/prolyl-tRNA synthetase associated domain-containing protein [Citrobacter freundii]MBJ8869548.1 YbaK/prolyl-tRNA synthetase associated domain-containing protein [Citrobacter braakii]MBJ8900809.1 YbaK/prolyl-tRNA synthetase associated domain-containing protein [Citrobacter braakii]MBJ8905464.1 YbaK/prolyl-tRNA synthetase associated domain-containing protein [Citrobacter braakii]MBJ8922421.1 YbaK/prolyl-tRNA synthetase associated domain-containing protein [Citrobacter braakii]